MTRRNAIHLLSNLAAWALVALMVGGPAHAQTTRFTYRGRLTDGGIAPNGTYDLRFPLVY